MRLPRKILACTDFSVAGNEAVAYAVELAAAQRELVRPPDAAELESRRLGGFARLQELARRLSRSGVSMRADLNDGAAALRP